MVEDEEHAQERNARIYAELAAVENLFYPFRTSKYDPNARGIKETMLKALQKAEMHAEDIDCISASANSVPQQDLLETMAIKDVFNTYASQIPVSAIKSMVGESVSAGGILQVAAAVGSLQKSFVPPTINYKEKDRLCDLDYVPNQSREMVINNILINNFGPGGHNASVIIRKY